MKTLHRQKLIGVVIPVPSSVARLANRVRRRYDPNYTLIGPHVTILPPRPLRFTRRQILDEVRGVAAHSRGIFLRLGKIRTFLPAKPVLFVALARGGRSLRTLHQKLASGSLRGPEAFPYFPHLTLGQDLRPEQLRKALELSNRIFNAAGVQEWEGNTLIVVRQQSPGRWEMMEPIPLSPPRRRPSTQTSGRKA